MKQDSIGEVAKYCFASESCVPARPLGEVLDGLLRDRCSWINYSNTPNNGFANQQQVLSSFY